MYYITIIRKGHKTEGEIKAFVPQKESGYSCSEYHIYEDAPDGTSIEILNYRFGRDVGAITKTIFIDRDHESVWIMNINGKTLRSILVWEKQDK